MNPTIPNDLGYTIRQLQAQIARQEQTISALQQANNPLDRLAQAIESQSARLEALARSNNHSRVAGAEDVPGPRVPRYYTVNIALSEGQTATASGEAVITNDGPFKCYAITASYIPTATTLTGSGVTSFLGRFIPVSTQQLVASAGATGSTTGTADVGVGLFTLTPDLSFQIQLAGTGRSWTPNVTELPGAAMFGVNGYFKLIEEALVPGGDRLVVTTKPERAMVSTGSVRVTFAGYQILTNLPVRY